MGFMLTLCLMHCAQARNDVWLALMSQRRRCAARSALTQCKNTCPYMPYSDPCLHGAVPLTDHAARLRQARSSVRPGFLPGESTDRLGMVQHERVLHHGYASQQGRMVACLRSPSSIAPR